MYVLGVKSKVTKHSDYFVWKDTSEHVTRRCDNIIDKKRANSCVLKKLFLGGSWATKKIAKKSRDSLSLSRFQNFAADAKKKTAHSRAVLND